MAKKSNLPAEIHDHFRKANALHGYVQESLGEAMKHALEMGQELLAAKKAIPHGRWEDECDRLFDGSARTAQFYMRFAKDVLALPKAHHGALLMLEGTLKGVAKAAKDAAKPPAPAPDAPESPETPPEPEADSSPPRPPNRRQRAKQKSESPDYGKCPNCAGTKWDEDDDGVSCSKCHHPWGEPAGDLDEDRIKTQRQKTVKTVEALMRAFDDLHTMKARLEHSGATTWTPDDVLTTLADMGVIQACKGLLKIARGWK